MAFREVRRPQVEKPDAGFGLAQLIPLLVSLGGKLSGRGAARSVGFDQSTEKGQIVGKYIDLSKGGTGAQPVKMLKLPVPKQATPKKATPEQAAPKKQQTAPTTKPIARAPTTKNTTNSKSQQQLTQLIMGKG